MTVETSFGPGYALLVASCIRCGAMCIDPDTMPSALVHEDTRCPIGPDGQIVHHRGQPGVYREPLCRGCVAVMHVAFQAGKGVPWPLARLDRIHFPAGSAVDR